MEPGTLGELFLTRSVIKHIRRHNKSMEKGAGVGSDASCIKVFDADSCIFETEGVSETPHIAWVKAMNNLAAAGGIPIGVRLVALLPQDTEESFIKKYMAEFNNLADSKQLQIMGGHTEVGRAYAHPSFVVSVTGISGAYKPDVKGIVPGDEIVMTKYTGLMGTDILAHNRFDELRTRFAESYIRGAFFDRQNYGISRDAEIAGDEALGIKYMHDVSYGGVYGSLWQLGSAIGRGIAIDNFRIPIRQETIEICEFFDINPYMLEGTGSLLMVAGQGEAVVQYLGSMDIEASVIGRVTDGKERIVEIGAEKRFLAPVKGDEIYKVLSGLNVSDDAL